MSERWTEKSLLKHLVEEANNYKGNEYPIESPILVDAREAGYDICIQDQIENTVVWLFDAVLLLLEAQLNDEKIRGRKLRYIIDRLKSLKIDIFFDMLYNKWEPLDMEIKK